MAYQHMVVEVRHRKVQDTLDKWGPQGFRVVGVYRRINRVVLIMERNL